MRSITHTVSILVLLDVALKEGVYGFEFWDGIPVSILVLLDVALKVICDDYEEIGEDVSILVLLDVALKGRDLFGIRVRTEGFQSLFSWMLL